MSIKIKHSPILPLYTDKDTTQCFLWQEYVCPPKKLVNLLSDDGILH